MTKKTMITNTSYLLNTWFKGEDGKLWPDVKKFLEDLDEGKWGEVTDGFVKVTFEEYDSQSERGTSK